jgi:stage V sporulation protein AD
MTTKKLGRQTVALSYPPSLLSFANVVGKKEGDGPLSSCFDYIDGDDTFGASTWEKSERAMQQKALTLALEKAGAEAAQLDWLFAGDLLNQCVSSSFAAREQQCPFFGLYGACSTMGEGLALAAMTLDGGFGQRAGVVVSSHFCTAERQYRTPLEYGSQRTPTAQWTVTAAGAVLLSREGPGPYLTHVTPGRVVDKGITDTNNMGAAMAPAAYDTIHAHLQDTGREPEFYDLIVTGDLGKLGGELLQELFQRDGVDLSSRYADCGLMIFDPKRQDVHCGGSGCGCSAAVLTGCLLPGMRAGRWDNILFCPTGALHSPTTACQGESIPGICHAIALSNRRPAS